MDRTNVALTDKVTLISGGGLVPDDTGEEGWRHVSPQKPKAHLRIMAIGSINAGWVRGPPTSDIGSESIISCATASTDPRLGHGAGTFTCDDKGQFYQCTDAFKTPRVDLGKAFGVHPYHVPFVACIRPASCGCTSEIVRSAKSVVFIPEGRYDARDP